MEELNLSGAWQGIFNYPRLLPPSQFEAELRDHWGVLTGETFEIGNGIRSSGKPAHAMVEGRRTGLAVSFVKQHDDLKRAIKPVFYSGTANDEGTEISGTWEIPGHWSGTFLMVRTKPHLTAVERQIVEKMH